MTQVKFVGNAQLGPRFRFIPRLAPRRSRPLPIDVRDFFYKQHNHVGPLDEAAERIYREAGLGPRSVHQGLAAWLKDRHSVQIVWGKSDTAQRRYDPVARTLHISAHLKQGQQAFQMVTQLAFLELGPVIDRLADNNILAGDEARRLARVGLANYFAGALILPYSDFLAAAEAEAYDIEKLSRRFGVGFETICHRLSTLQRAEARGIPFFFVRVDRAGNISKRQSATDFHFSRVGRSCPLWNVYEALPSPGRTLTQIAQMPEHIFGLRERLAAAMQATVSRERRSQWALDATFGMPRA